MFKSISPLLFVVFCFGVVYASGIHVLMQYIQPIQDIFTSVLAK